MDISRTDDKEDLQTVSMARYQTLVYNQNGRAVICLTASITMRRVLVAVDAGGTAGSRSDRCGRLQEVDLSCVYQMFI